MTADELRALVSEWPGEGWLARKDRGTGVFAWSNEDDARLIALAPQIASLLADAMEWIDHEVDPHSGGASVADADDLIERFAALGETG